MKISLFCELSVPRPWTDDSDQHVVSQALEQIELADRLGFHKVWTVEHHFLEEFSHSAAPEILLAAASQRTSRIRLGHGIVQLIPAVNHPARVAERVAMLDLVSGGRAEFGTGEGSSDGELGGFRVDPGKKREMWEEALAVAVGCLSDTPFPGFNGDFVQMPPRNVVPKPIQRPHPPVWVACSRRDTIRLAAQSGLGALTFAWMDPEQATEWVDEYYRTLVDECVPITRTVNANIAATTIMACSNDPTVIARAVEGGNFFGYGLVHYYINGTHTPGSTNLWDEFIEMQAAAGYSPEAAIDVAGTLSAKVADTNGAKGLRGSVGTPDQIRDFLRRYEQSGIDELIFIVQGGRTRHEDIMGSLELFGKEVLPEFLDRDEEAVRKKAERLGPAIEAAMGRRAPDRVVDPSYSFGAMPTSWEDGKPADEFMELFTQVMSPKD